MDVNKIRKDFPILNEIINDEPLIYFDNAATTQKPQVVLDAIMNFYQTSNANIHRGVHTLAERATRQYEEARNEVQAFIHANRREEVIFTSGTTDAMNLVCTSFGDVVVQAGDEIYVSPMDHHSTIVPMQQLAIRKGAQLKYLPLLEDGRLDMEAAQTLMSSRSKLIAICHASNVLGVINDVKALGEMIHRMGGYIIVDGAQYAPHASIDVVALDCDFYAFSGHKMLAPTGIGVLYGKLEHLQSMPPYRFGGEMIGIVEETTSTWADLPHKFEAGTPNIAGAIGLAAAIQYINAIGFDCIERHGASLMTHALTKLQTIEGVTIHGPLDADHHHGLISFAIEGLHPHDIATGFDMEGIAIRAGHHCAQPLMRYLGVSSTARISFYIYNTIEEVDQFITSLIKVKEFFSHGFI